MDRSTLDRIILGGIIVALTLAAMAIAVLARVAPAAAADADLCVDNPDASYCAGPSDQGDDRAPVPPDDSCAIGLACDPRWDDGGEWWPDEAAPPIEVELGPATVVERAAQTTQIAHRDADTLPVTGTPAALLALLGALMAAGGGILVTRTR